MRPYPERRRVIVEALAAAGVEVFPTQATFYVWARVPGEEDSLDFCARVLRDHGVVLTPGVGFGPGGEGWFRISLTAPDERVAAAAARLREL
jgi:LL-diaminopimelate aminotransferase